jgi:uncharacterized membrane protein
MKKIVLLMLPAIFLAACSSTTSTQNQAAIATDTIPEPIKIRTVDLEGLYANNHLVNCANKGEITITGNTKKLDSLYKALLPTAYTGQMIYLKVKGTLATQGLTDSLTITEIFKAEQKNEQNTCVPYDYWCMGNEPFWRIQISAAENLIDFFDPMIPKYYHFKFVKPETINKSTVYTTELDGNKIKITITNQKCSDGMSERKYPCKAEVTLNGKAYKGCAMTYESASQSSPK